MTQKIIAIVFAFLLAGMAAVTRANSAPQTVVLTIAGEVENTNRGNFDPFADIFLKHHEKSFDRAFSVTTEMLSALKQHKVMANAQGWPGKVTLEGPLLRDVLALAGATGKPLTIFALDGYGAEFTQAKLNAHEWLLATHANGKSLPIGGHGPAWVIYDTKGKKVSEEEETAWVWAVFYIEAGKVK